MFSKIKITIVFFLLAGSLKYSMAQENLNYPIVNSETYSQYLNGQWKGLVKTGKKSLKSGIDFYYLQVRMGVANYKLKRYRQAIPYFEKALKQVPDDEFVKEFLYFTYLFSGRQNDAKKLASNFTDEFKHRIKIKTSTGISAIEFETKFDFWNDYRDYTANPEELTQEIQNEYSYFSLGVKMGFKKGSSFTISYSRIAVSKEFSIFNSVGTPTFGEKNVFQNQFYVKYNTNIAKGLNFILAANLLYISIDELSQTSSTGFQGGANNTLKSQTSASEYVAYAAFSKDFSLFKLGVFASISNLSNNTQIQPGAYLTFYPFGNANFYTHSILYHQMENSVNRTIHKHGFGVNFWGLYIEPSYTFGELQNFTEGEGFIVNNGIDLINDRFEVLVYTWLLKGKLNLFVKYQNYTTQNNYLIVSTEYSINYNYKTITGGLKWNF